MNFETYEFIKHRINYGDIGDDVDRFKSRAIMSTSTVVLWKKIERFWFHKFYVLTVFRDPPTTFIDDKHIQKNIEKLTKNLVQDTSQKDKVKHVLEECVGEMFACSDHQKILMEI